MFKVFTLALKTWTSGGIDRPNPSLKRGREIKSRNGRAVHYSNFQDKKIVFVLYLPRVQKVKASTYFRKMTTIPTSRTLLFC